MPKPCDLQGGSTEVRQCPVCHCEKRKEVGEARNFVLSECEECGCKYIRNPPSKSDLERFYNREEWFNGGELGGYRDYDEQTVSSLELIKCIFDGIEEANLSILDVGCGYGSHLQIAVAKGWRCFGVEPSDHARLIAQERLGHRAMIVKSINELIPHCFDIILLLDVVEHVSNPEDLFYPLFNLGGIQDTTRIILTTPNAGSVRANVNISEWPFFHPPSHLTFYSSSSLQKLLCKLRFRTIEIQGIHPSDSIYDSEPSIENCEGLLVQARGSDFIKFMQERYVPSTCSEITEYEHLPRYRYAQSLAQGKTILDFGCGTGYGTAILADFAETALGVDIDESALQWARETHRKPNLQFVRNSDFAVSLPRHNFDLITCFEMIEHVIEEHQKKILDGFVHALKPEGVLLISTPNPETTALYGENPYHLCELSRAEFRSLLEERFKHVQLIDQHALVGVLFATEFLGELWQLNTLHNSQLASTTTLGYLALCSQRPLKEKENHIYIDNDNSYIPLVLELRKQNVEARVRAYENEMRIQQCFIYENEASEFKQQRDQLSVQLEQLKNQHMQLINQSHHLSVQLEELTNQHLQLMQQPPSLRRAILHKLRKLLPPS